MVSKTPPLERIRRLLKVADQTHHEGEAENARALARKLQDQHGITDDQVAGAQRLPGAPFGWTTTNGANANAWQFVNIHITYSDQDATYAKFMQGMAEVRAQLQATEDVFGWQRWYENQRGQHPTEDEWREAYAEALKRRRHLNRVPSDPGAEFAGWERVAQARWRQGHAEPAYRTVEDLLNENRRPHEPQ